QALVQSTLTKSLNLKNTGTATLTLNSLAASGDYSLSGACTTVEVLAANATCALSVSFKPSVTGTILGAVSITDNAPGSPHLITLSGTGLTTLSVSPTSQSFGTVTVGST